MTKTFGSYLSGGGLVDIGAKMAGYTLTFAVEYDPQIAAVYRKNLGDHIIVADVRDIDPETLPYVDLFHASPVCTNASIANNKRGEQPIDIETAKATAAYIRAKHPGAVTIENVSQYREFEAYRVIIRALDECGYWHNADTLNSADMGVPQTRRRLVVRAVRGGFVPYLPEPVKWVGWYEAIQDLIPTLPDSEFADWQIARLPKELSGTGYFSKSELTQLIAGETMGDSPSSQPATTVTANELSRPCHSPRAFIVDGCNARADVVTTGCDHEPVFTVDSSQKGAHRAFVIDGQESSSATGLQIVDQDSPHQTVTASVSRHPSRAWLQNGRVVKMTPRALARFQSIPDWYELPDNPRLAGKIIGNGVPCLMYQRIAEQF